MCIPESVSKRFNWGAFFLGWIWGLFHKSFITLIQLPLLLFHFPFSNLIFLGVAIWFGIKGNAWAWENMGYVEVDEDEFHELERRWAVAGPIIFGIVVLFAGCTLFMPH